jgi:hypothetical protein
MQVIFRLEIIMQSLDLFRLHQLQCGLCYVHPTSRELFAEQMVEF